MANVNRISLPTNNVLTVRFLKYNRAPASNGRPTNGDYLALNKIIQFSQDDTVRATLLDAASKNRLIRQGDVEKYVTYVRERGRRIFLLLVFMEKLEYIGELRRSCLKDDDLPLFAVDNGQYITLQDSQNKHWRSFDGWPDSLKEAFVSFQWFFLARSLSTSAFVNKFHEKQPLNFRAVDGRAGSGGFGVVQKTEVPIVENAPVSGHELHPRSPIDKCIRL